VNWSKLRRFPWLDNPRAVVASAPRDEPDGLGFDGGETLGHFAELRPDLRLFAVDLEGKPERYPLAVSSSEATWSDSACLAGSLDGCDHLHAIGRAL